MSRACPAAARRWWKMELECLLKKLLLVLALACCAPAAALANQVTSVRVGPVSEESAPDNPPAAKKDEKKDDARAGDRNGSGDNKSVDADRKNDKDAKAPARTDAKPAGPKASDPPAVSSNNNRPAPPAGTTAAPQATSDGPVKASDPAMAPAGGTRSTLSAERPTGTPVGSGALPANPLPAAPAPPAPTSIYKVGVGDVLDIRLLNTNQRESTLFTVMPGGLVDYPLAGDPFNVAGMTTDEIAVRVAAELRRRAVFDRPQVLVSVRDYASHTVLVSGLVNDPGVKILRREAIPLYVLVAEAQPKPEAGRAVIMSHATGQTRSVDLTDAQGMATLVYPSDVVNMILRPQEYYYVGGEVGSPGQKEFHSGLTLTQALLASGGTTRAAASAVRVSRQGADGRLSSNVYDLNLIRDGKVPDPQLQPGDRIEVEQLAPKKK